MIKLTIDNHTFEVQPGTSVWQAAQSVGIEIPTMCYLEGTEHFTSCMICLVKDTGNGRFFASCSTPVIEGHNIITNDEETIESRKAALELLLSEHVGDCEAPCQLVCPAHMNIPLMNRLIAKGDFAKALEVVKRDIALPSTLGRICPAPCEAGCRRKQVDEAVSICLLKRYVGDEDLKCENPYQPQLELLSGKKVAIIGSGPAGLAAAYYLQQKGHQAIIFERNNQAGGELLQIDSEILPVEIIEQEVAQILATGVQIRLNETIDDTRFAELQNEFDAVVVAFGAVNEETYDFGLMTTKTGIFADKASYLTSIPNVFAVGNSLRASKLAVRSVGQGKEVATVIGNYFRTSEVKGYPERFNSKFGRLAEVEFIQYQKDSENAPRQKADRSGFTKEAAIREAKRCMHCDCRNPESCVLRELSDRYHAVQKRFQSEVRFNVEKFIHREGIVYEPAKCIKCGICVRLTRQHQEEFGFTFIGRGFDVKIGVPFNESVQKGLEKTAEIVAKACPTGALAMFNTEEQI
ncbi:MAG: FAD-dependent oxidoreductase [Bacteroidota bacterium]|nr:glutamate synthase [Odoribacter sp.]MDP3644970.1 FAD-dependent oxidoreductase [Bacteroidota bacterium]